MKVKAK